MKMAQHLILRSLLEPSTLRLGSCAPSTMIEHLFVGCRLFTMGFSEFDRVAPFGYASFEEVPIEDQLCFVLM